MTPEEEYSLYNRLEDDMLTLSKRIFAKLFIDDKELIRHGRYVSMKFGTSTPPHLPTH